ncbi:MAG: hypothetical protein QM688_05010 [Sphingomonas bacterium]
MIDEKDFLAMRALQEHRRADAAADKAIASIHRRMAVEYDRRARQVQVVEVTVTRMAGEGK